MHVYCTKHFYRYRNKTNNKIMRPDEHKKNKNAQYKKKHGIQEKISEHGNEGGKFLQQLNKDEAMQGKKQSISLQPTETKPGYDLVTEPQGQGFSKRAVESNWERYQPIHDDEIDQGTDYNVLLSFAGSASSHMKLKCEEEWDSQEDFAFLSIDQKHLVESFADIPFAVKYKLKDLDMDPNLLGFIANVKDSELSVKSDFFHKRMLSTHQTNKLGFNFTPEFSSVNVKKLNHNNVTLKVKPKQESSKHRNTTHTFEDKNTEENIAEGNLDVVETSFTNTGYKKPNYIPTDADDLKNKVSNSTQLQNLILPNTEKILPNTAESASVSDNSKTLNVPDADNKDEKPSNNAVGDLEDWLDSIL